MNVWSIEIMSPKTKEQFQEIRQKSMANIKQVALELFAHNGFHSTSISQIANEAGVSKGLMYNYFSGKEDLLKSIISEVIELGEQFVEIHFHSSDDPFEQIKGIIESTTYMVKTNLHYWKLLTSLIFQTDALKGVEDMIKRKQEMAIGQMIDLFERLGAKQPEKEAFYYAAVLDGMIIHYMQMEDSYPLDEMKDFILEQIKKISKQ